MNSRNQAILQQLRGGLVVSCQALPEEPLHSSYIMSRMAYAAYLGGAVGIRANTVEDIAEIRKTVSLPSSASSSGCMRTTPSSTSPPP